MNALIPMLCFSIIVIATSKSGRVLPAFLLLKGRYGGADTGLILKSGEWGNLPGGEVFAAPVEGSARGTLVVPAGWYPGLENDMKLVFEDGYVTSIQGGGRTGDKFRGLLKIGDDLLKHRRNCGELGIGTNPNAKKPDNVLEAEKIKGTVHIAIGDSSHMGGQNESDLHEDFVLTEPTLILDDYAVIEKGVYKIPVPSHTDGICLYSTVWADAVKVIDNEKVVHPELIELVEKLGK